MKTSNTNKMKQITQPLKNNWKIDEDAGLVPDQIQERCDSESWYTYCKGFPNIKQEDIKGRLGNPIKEELLAQLK